MPAKPHYREIGEETSEWRIGDVWIPSTSYLPEVRSQEEMYSTAECSRVLDDGNPVILPPHKWGKLKRKQPNRATKIETNHSVAFYEPPELLTDSHIRALKDYSLKGAEQNDDIFEKLLEAGEVEEALSLFPEFHRDFIEANLDTLYPGKSEELPNEIIDKDISTAWENLTEDIMEDYFNSILGAAKAIRNVAFIPPVPRLTRESGDKEFEKVSEVNRKMAEVCSSGIDRSLQSDVEDFSGEMAGDGGIPEIAPYFHIYASENILKRGGDDIGEELINLLYNHIDWGRFAGIAITIKNPSRFWEGSLSRVQRLRSFVENITKEGHRRGLPVISLRFRWFGAFLTDFGIDAYSSLVNGSNEYPKKFPPSNLSDEEQYAKQYGATNILEEARDLSIRPTEDEKEGLKDYLQENGGLPELEGFEDITEPPGFDPDGDYLREIFGVPADFRKEFRNPWELSHARKAQELREKRQNGIENPGEEYLHSSKTNYGYE